jgi:hypothetical protein
VRALVLVVVLLLSGCATIHNPLSATDVAQLRIESVDITVRPDAVIHWARAEQEFAATHASQQASKPKRVSAVNPNETGHAAVGGTSEYDALVASPEAKAFMRHKLVGMVDGRMKSDVVPLLQGTRGVRLQIEIVSFVIPSALQRAVIGGAPIFAAITTLKDAKTGAELAKLDQGTSAMAGNGLIGVLVDQAFSDLEERLMNTYVEQVRSWLLRK